MGNFKLAVEREELKVSCRDVADDGDRDVAAGFPGGKQLGASRFIQAADPSPEIKLPRSVAGEKDDIGDLAVVEHGKTVFGILATSKSALVIEPRKEER